MSDNITEKISEHTVIILLTQTHKSHLGRSISERSWWIMWVVAGRKRWDMGESQRKAFAIRQEGLQVTAEHWTVFNTLNEAAARSHEISVRCGPWWNEISCREPRVQPFHITLTNFIKLSKVETNYLKLNKCRIYFSLTSCGAPQLWVRCCRRFSKINYNIKLTPTHPPPSHVSKTQLSIMTLCLVFAASKNNFKPNWSKITAWRQLPMKLRH